MGTSIFKVKMIIMGLVMVTRTTTSVTNLMFHVIENLILFHVEIVGFTYMITLIIYHENL